MKVAVISETAAALRLAELFIASGAVRADGDSLADLAIVGASNLQQGREALEQLSVDTRARSLLIGLDEETLDARRRPAADNLGGLLEHYQPLGVLVSVAVNEWQPSNAGFIGRRELAEKMGSAFLNLHATRNYAAYMTCNGSGAVDFLSRYLSAAVETAGPDANR